MVAALYRTMPHVRRCFLQVLHFQRRSDALHATELLEAVLSIDLAHPNIVQTFLTSTRDARKVGSCKLIAKKHIAVLMFDLHSCRASRLVIAVTIHYCTKLIKLSRVILQSPSPLQWQYLTSHLCQMREAERAQQTHGACLHSCAQLLLFWSMTHHSCSLLALQRFDDKTRSTLTNNGGWLTITPTIAIWCSI